MPGILVHLGILPVATVLVTQLFIAACGAGVPSFDIKTTGETHVPVVEVFNWVGWCVGRVDSRRRNAKC